MILSKVPKLFYDAPIYNVKYDVPIVSYDVPIILDVDVPVATMFSYMMLTAPPTCLSMYQASHHNYLFTNYKIKRC